MAFFCTSSTFPIPYAVALLICFFCAYYDHVHMLAFISSNECTIIFSGRDLIAFSSPITFSFGSLELNLIILQVKPNIFSCKRTKLSFLIFTKNINNVKFASAESHNIWPKILANWSSPFRLLHPGPTVAEEALTGTLLNKYWFLKPDSWCKWYSTGWSRAYCFTSSWILPSWRQKLTILFWTKQIATCFPTHNCCNNLMTLLQHKNNMASSHHIWLNKISISNQMVNLNI